jgi:predicted RND superfamily exporter protein
MTKRFYSIPVPFFGSVALLILCCVAFLIPFAGRGARLAMDEMVNNVADWLPDDYQETKELKEFKKYFFGGGQFVVISGPWCKEGDPTFVNLKRKIYEESLDYEDELIQQGRTEELRAHRKGDELGLLFADKYHQDWGEQAEKWLQGRDKQWYFINRRGQLFRWEGQSNVAEGISRYFERLRNGKNKAVGKYIDTFGLEPDDRLGIKNKFYEDPLKLCCRPFKSVISGPEVFDELAGPDGSLRVLKMGESDRSTFQAKMEAHKRLTGAMFGPTPHQSFDWTFQSLLQQVDDDLKKTLVSQPVYQSRFDEFMKAKIAEDFDGSLDALLSAVEDKQLELWYQLWFQLELEAPPRQTCLVVTLNEPVMEELARAVGRPLLGKPRGRLLELATGSCGISPQHVNIGGPPSDNVAIDEEGTITLVNLVGLSAMIGITLAYFSFRNVRVTMMLFITGGVGAMASLAYVWFGGEKMDAILMSMPSLIYVLGLSGAVHIVNYYRDACHEHGHKLAAEAAISHSWFPCTLAAFTTALGLGSLYISNLAPISKFGLFSAIATVATLIILFTFLPSALTVFNPGYRRLSKREKELGTSSAGISASVTRFWQRVGEVVMENYTIFAVLGVLAIVVGAYGIGTKIQTQVHLLKMFDPGAKILVDYRWLEENLGELVPAEIVVSVEPSAQQEVYRETIEQAAKTKRQSLAQRKSDNTFDGDALIANDSTASDTPSASPEPIATDVPKATEDESPPFEFSSQQQKEYARRLSMLERVQLSDRVRTQLERFFGPDGLGIVGSGLSTDVFVPLNEFSSTDPLTRKLSSAQLYKRRGEMLEQEYLAIADEGQTRPQTQLQGRELWRISIRLAALSDVDYGRFINDMKSVIEPINNAYRYRRQILTALQETQDDGRAKNATVLVLGGKPELTRADQNIKAKIDANVPRDELINQTHIFSTTLKSLLADRGISKSPKLVWVDPEKYSLSNPDLTPKEKEQLNNFFQPKAWRERIRKCDCVVLIENDELFDVEMIKRNATHLVDCRDHKFLINPETKAPIAGMKTATERKMAGESVDITTIYTGIIPIVYKAQRALLWSLIESILLAFIMITVVMMLLLRDWKRPFERGNYLNIRGGLLAMIPNVFPVVVVFGFMAYRGIKVDIGSMMTASVAMGVAVDDTIHFLTWYREALQKGLERLEAIKVAYAKVATAMTQTTLIAGFGLSAFAFSTFTPTQRFGTLMLFLLAAALIGDLIILPAVLASPLGKYFSKIPPADGQASDSTIIDPEPDHGIRVISDQSLTG